MECFNTTVRIILFQNADIPYWYSYYLHFLADQFNGWEGGNTNGNWLKVIVLHTLFLKFFKRDQLCLLMLCSEGYLGIYL